MRSDATPDEVTKEQKEKVRRQIELTKKTIELREGLPFLHGWPWYQWAWDFFNSTNKINLLTAANQVSKSSTQIRKCINWATDKTLWPSLWRRPPTQFWYMYPSQKVVNAEFLTKWMQFLPAGKYRDDPVYGWKEQKENGNTVAIHFKSGVHVYFKTYSQNPEDLQSASLDALFCDEEMPEELYDELTARMNATDGYFHMVFTATLGQDFWRTAMEPREDEEERFPTALKICVSLYDSQEYMDGSPSPWTDSRIANVKARCKNQAEFLRRVMGRFVLSSGRKYPTFDATRHMRPKHPLPAGWLVYEGVDVGGSGENRQTHKSAICFVAVRPDFRAGRIFLGWRGGKELTTAGDVFQKHLELKKSVPANLPLVRRVYDWGAKDFDTISTRAGEPFEKANKTHDVGEDILNTLFKNDMLLIYEDAELCKLGSEFSTLQESTKKIHAKDDFIDAARYACAAVPWDFTYLTGEAPTMADTPEKPLNQKERELAERRKHFDEKSEDEGAWEIQAEMDLWNDQYGS